MKVVALMIISLLCVFGLAEIIHTVRLYIYSPKKAALSYLVINLEPEYAESQLRYMGELYLWNGKRIASNVVAVNDRLDAAVKESCREIAEKYNIIYCSGKEICDTAQLLFGKGF